MTRTQTRPYGVITPSTRQPLLEAMLRAFAWFVSNVVSMFRTIFYRPTRDWHTSAAGEVQPTPNDLTQETLQAEPTGLSTGSGLKPASPAQAGVQTPHNVRTRNPSALRVLTGPLPSRGTRVATSRASKQRACALPAHADECRHTGRMAPLVPPCSFIPAHASKPFLDSDSHPELVEGRRNERCALRIGVSKTSLI